MQMNIQLTEVLTDVMGLSGQAIIRAIVAGERDPKTLALHRNPRVKASEEEIARALTGNWREEHLFVLKQSLAMYDHFAGQLSEFTFVTKDGTKASVNVDAEVHDLAQATPHKHSRIAGISAANV